MGRHAYLIMAHSRMDLLKALLKNIDYIDNDIFVHLDSKMGSINCKELADCCKYSTVYFTERFNVVWGAFSQIECELALLKKACEIRKYEYLHLLSGQDLPIRNQSYIHKFFDKNCGKEFVHFESRSLQGANFEKIAFFFPLQNLIGGSKNCLYYLQRIFIRLQRVLHVNRIKNVQVRFAKGANWFSITGKFAEYILKNEQWIRCTFCKTLCCDEFFIQTLLINSRYKENLYYQGFDDNYIGNMRYIEWEEGTCNPKIITQLDVEKLLKTDMLFARKIEQPFDGKIMDLLYAIK